MTYRWRFTVTQFDGGQTWIEPGYGEYVADNRLAALLIWLTLRKAPARWVVKKERVW